MGNRTLISWADGTFNPWKGCAKVSPACYLCYAKTGTERWGMDLWGRNKPREVTSPAYWKQPLAWNRRAAASGRPFRVFCASWADVFEDHPDVVDARARLWDLIDRTPALTWMLLTKRPENIAGMVPWGQAWPANVWLGVSAENQRYADQRIAELVVHQAAVRFISAEPCLGPIDLTRIPMPGAEREGIVWDVVNKVYGLPGVWREPLARGVDWVITGGESGRNARPTHPDWFRKLRNQCESAGVAYHHKQNGIFTADVPDLLRKPTLWVSDRPHSPSGRVVTVADEKDIPQSHETWYAMWKVGKARAGRALDGQVWQQFPDDMSAPILVHELELVA